MKAVFKKLKSKAGESLVESLAAILIFTMASIVMYSMITSAADINSTVKEMDKENQEHMLAIERGLPESSVGGNVLEADGIVKFYIGGDKIAESEVDIFGDKDTLYTYYTHTGG